MSKLRNLRAVKSSDERGNRELSPEKALQLKRLFKMMANDTRLRILHALMCSRELCVNDLARTVAMKPQAISNQLQRMSDQRIVESRREGTSIYYSIQDPCVPEIIDRALCLVEMSGNIRSKKTKVR